MPKKKSSPPERGPLRLIVDRHEAAEKIEARIEKGHELLEREIRSSDELESAKRDFKRWDDFNAELLRQLFSTSEVADEYTFYGAGVFVLGREVYLAEEVEEFREDVQKKITRLQSIADRLEIIPLAEGVPETGSLTPTTAVAASNRVFVVHGHNEAARETTARLLERLGLEPVILNEQPNAGRTLIEKFETYADVSFAVVLLTADDVGAPASAAEELHPRARQNVIFELGFFIGKLGRRKVCALYQEGVEILSDFQGVAYVPLDAGGAWKFQLAKELKESGLEVDMNNVL